jgi:hypothetical protein
VAAANNPIEFTREPGRPCSRPHRICRTANTYYSGVAVVATKAAKPAQLDLRVVIDERNNAPTRRFNAGVSSTS